MCSRSKVKCRPNHFQGLLYNIGHMPPDTQTNTRTTRDQQTLPASHSIYVAAAKVIIIIKLENRKGCCCLHLAIYSYHFEQIRLYNRPNNYYCCNILKSVAVLHVRLVLEVLVLRQRYEVWLIFILFCSQLFHGNDKRRDEASQRLRNDA